MVTTKSTFISVREEGETRGVQTRISETEPSTRRASTAAAATGTLPSPEWSGDGKAAAIKKLYSLVACFDLCEQLGIYGLGGVDIDPAGEGGSGGGTGRAETLARGAYTQADAAARVA